MSEPEQIADRFFEDGRLVQVPAKLWKRRLVFERIVQVFELGREYHEVEVNETLRAFDPDVASLRR